ncbi:MAG: ParB N-terminal domain-containing protein [Desulfobacterales bacterium]|nr:ParB N-terminal domain-containing protein [Desulfobacterales bacterium]
MNFKDDFVCLSTIDLSSIDLEDDTFRITTDTGIKKLIFSIKNVGLLNPPILLKKTSSFQVISGFRRISAYINLDRAKIPARIVASDKKKLECLELAITDNSLQRSLNLIEQSRSLSKLSEFYTENNQLTKAASVLGLPENPAIIEKIKNICILPLEIQNGVLSNTISLTMAIELGKLKKHEGAAFAIFFDNFKLSLNKQKEIITHIKEIAIIENISIINLLTKNYLQEILADQELDRNQKINLIRSYLKQRRFPQITKAEKNLEEKIKQLNLQSNIKLIAPKNFEATTFSLNLQFDNMGQLGENKTALEKMIKNPLLKDILV